MEQTTSIDLERQKKAKAYARISRRLMLVDLALGAIYVFAWLIFGWSTSIKAWLSSMTTNDWLLVALYAAVFGGIYLLVNLPLSYYEEYVLPHRYDQSNQNLRGWISDQLIGLAVSAILGGLVLEIIYGVLRAFPDTWWLWAAGILLLFSVLLANLAPTLIMPIFNKFTPLEAEHADLAQRLTLLAERAHTHVQGVYKFDLSRRTKSANAALTGLGNSRRIILGDTLIKEFSPDEIETVLAHELGHQVNKDILWGIILQTLLTLVGLFLAAQCLKWGVTLFGFNGTSDIAALPVFALAMGVFGLVTMPATNAFSRWREVRADAYALKATGKSKAFASAFARLANQNLSDADPEPWVEWLLYSHPALNKRIQMAEDFERLTK